jgi:hypothetical protein
MTVMNARIMWVVVIAAIALLVVFGADRRRTTTVSLRNEADVTLTDVKIALAGKEIWNGKIEPGEKQYARGRPDRDGAVRISFRAGNAGPLSADFGRAAASAGDEYDFLVTSDFEIRAVPPP